MLPLNEIEFLVARDRKLNHTSLKPKGNLAHRMTKARIMVPSRLLGSGLAG